MTDPINFLVSEYKDDRDDLKREIRDAVGDGNPCTICGVLVPMQGLDIHDRWHLRVREQETVS